ncbi:MAG TPA: response regulator, partial [Thermoanaerobaculia bacterium]
TNEGSISVSLSIVGGAYARLEVTDTGRGIDPAFLPHVWDRFRQADSSTSREFGGLGLGLAVVKNLVEMHGGVAIAGSAGLGHGATFRVDLPLARVLPLPASEERPVDTGRLAGKRILVVDDDEDARLVLAAMLRQDGATVTGVATADEAMQQFALQRFDAVLSDLAMPGEDGYSLVRRLHALRDVPVIAVSAIGTGADDRKRAIGAGFAEFVRKPVDPDELVATVAGLS